MSDNKDKILTAASGLLLERGLEGLSVRGIAQRAGLSTIAIYSHFQGKQGVLDALYIEGFDYVKAAVEAVSGVSDPAEAVRQGAENYLDLARDHEGHYRLIFGESGGEYTPSPEAAQAAQVAFAALVAQVSQVLPSDSSQSTRQRAALRIWAVLHGYVSLRHHVIGEALDYRQWKSMAMESMQIVISDLGLASP